MIEVRLMLHDAAELKVFHGFALELEDRRRAWIDRQRTKTLGTLPSEAEQAEQQEIFDAGHAGDDPAAIPTPVLFATSKEPLVRFEPSAEQMEAAVKAFATSKGMPAARALLDEFQVQRVGEVTGEQRAALYARLTA